MAWYVWSRYSSRGQAIDLVGHSMGGLIMRYAIAATAARTFGFPPYPIVEHAVTLGSPH